MRSVVWRDDQRPNIHPVDWHHAGRSGPWLDTCTWSVWNQICLPHPESVELLIEHRDFGQVFDPVCGVPARHDEACRKAIEHGKRLAVHLVRDEDVRIARDTRNVEALDEIGDASEARPVETFEGDIEGSGFDAGLRQNLAKPDASPFSIAHRAIRPLAAEHSGREVAPPIARALIDGHDAGASELTLQVIERKLEWLVDVTGDP